MLALDGKTYALTAEMCVIADGSGALGLGGVMGGESTGCSDETTDVFVESAWFDPLRTAQTGRATGIASDAQYRFARTVDTGFIVPGLELATRMILELCGGEPSDIVVAGQAPATPGPIVFDPAYVTRLSGLSVDAKTSLDILAKLGCTVSGSGSDVSVTPPSWRRDIEGKADLVEEVARIVGYGALPSTPLPPVASDASGVLTPRQNRARMGRRALAAMGYSEAVTWSFTARKTAELFGGGGAAVVLSNPIASDLDCMRPSILPNLIEAAGRNAKRGFADCALFEVGPVFAGDRPKDQRTAITALIAPHAPRRWDGGGSEDVFTIKADLMALLDDLGAPTASLQTVQGSASPWWHPGRSARLQLGPKAVIAEFGALHPRILSALDVDGPVYAFELWLDAVPEQRRKSKARPGYEASSLMPLSRDFAFVVPVDQVAGDLVKAVIGADKALISGARVFDAYQGTGIEPGHKSIALEVSIAPKDKTLTEAEIEALSAKIIAAAQKAGGRLRV